MSKPRKTNVNSPGKKRGARATRAAGVETPPVRASHRSGKKAMIASVHPRTRPDAPALVAQRLVGRPKNRAKPRVPKLPRLIQSQIDYLIAKGETKGLRADERAQLDEVLDYLDDLTIFQLERAKLARN